MVEGNILEASVDGAFMRVVEVNQTKFPGGREEVIVLVRLLLEGNHPQLVGCVVDLDGVNLGYVYSTRYDLSDCCTYLQIRTDNPNALIRAIQASTY